MRTIGPENNKQSLPKTIFNVIIPFRLIKQRYFLSIIIGKDFIRIDKNASLTQAEKFLNIIMLSFFIFMIIFVILAGLFFLMYLVKCAMGLDFFKNAHLFE